MEDVNKDERQQITKEIQLLQQKHLDQMLKELKPFVHKTSEPVVPEELRPLMDRMQKELEPLIYRLIMLPFSARDA